MEINYIEYHRYENRIELVIKYLEREREREFLKIRIC